MDWPSAATPNIVVNGDGSRSFRDRNLLAGIVGSQPLSADFNAVWTELITVIETGGQTPNAAINDQLLVALFKLFGGSGSLAINGYMTLPGGLLMQWGSVSFSGVPSYPSTYWGIDAEVQVGRAYGVFPIAFPSACFGLVATGSDAPSTLEGSEMNVGIQALTLTGFTATLSRSSGHNGGGETGYVFYIALGY